MPDGITTPKFGDTRLPKRFWDKVRIDPDGCWRWTRCKSSGYGRFAVDGKPAYAHLVIYRALVGPIPDGLVADHECHKPETCGGGEACLHRSCVNPMHIGLKTNAENTSRGRVSHWSSKKTHCPQGHRYGKANTRVDQEGRRFCRACERIRSAKRFEAHKKGLTVPALHVVTHCRNGHEYTPENSGTNAAGSRYCRTCSKQAGKAARDAHRAANPLPVKTHCPQGHEYTPENTRLNRGARQCRVCDRERARARRAAARGKG